MPEDTAPPVQVWSVKFFSDLRNLTPTRLAYISRSSEAEVARERSNAWPMKKPPVSRFAASSSTHRYWQRALSTGSIKRPGVPPRARHPKEKLDAGRSRIGAQP